MILPGVIASDVYTKIQAVAALFVLAFEILTPTSVVHAASTIEEDITVENGVVIGKEFIQPPKQSLVMLEGDELVNSQANWEMSIQTETKPVATVFMTASAYNSVPWQTDGSPYHTAIGSMTRDGVVASNYFPIGTRITFPDLYGDKEFRVEDRMNPRYFKTVDIWMDEISQARQFGRKYVRVEVIKYGLGRGME